jgi:hypothetical protein
LFDRDVLDKQIIDTDGVPVVRQLLELARVNGSSPMWMLAGSG